MSYQEDHGAWLLWPYLARAAAAIALVVFPIALLVARRLVR